MFHSLLTKSCVLDLVFLCHLSFDLCYDVMGQVSESGLADLLSSDQIHWSDKGRALVRAVISRHIATTKY